MTEGELKNRITQNHFNPYSEIIYSNRIMKWIDEAKEDILYQDDTGHWHADTDKVIKWFGKPKGYGDSS